MDKSIFNFKIQYQDGSIIDLHEDKNIWVSSFRIPSLSPSRVTERIESRHGSILLGTTLLERRITASFSVEALNPQEFDLFRDELFRVFDPLQKLYIIRDLQPDKRLEVWVDSDFTPEYITLEDGEFDIEFVMYTPFLESVGTTLHPAPSDYIFQVGRGRLQDTDPLIQYVFNQPSFSVWNDGDIAIDPRERELKIIFTGVSSELSIRNLTTGDEWAYTGDTEATDTILLQGIRSLKNGSSIFGQTNRKLITLAPGWNEFEITGATDFTISFDFRFYYV
jgi:hypothetical protein